MASREIGTRDYSDTVFLMGLRAFTDAFPFIITINAQFKQLEKKRHKALFEQVKEKSLLTGDKQRGQ